MTTYYVGSGGNDGNDGLTWGARKLTLNGVEDIPVVAGDTVYVAPGVYRELLTCDVSGSAGNPITYIGDVTGEHTDGIGGIVRVTGSDNDTSTARNYGITGTGRNFRTFRGFRIDACTLDGIILDGTNWIVEDCAIFDTTRYGIYVNGANQASNTFRRCCMFGCKQTGILFYHSADVAGTSQLVENCLILDSDYGLHSLIEVWNIDGITIKHCLLSGGIGAGVRVQANTGNPMVTVRNSMIQNCWRGFNAVAAGDIDENYNNLYGNNANRTNTNIGANSTTYPPLLAAPLLLDGIRLPWWFGTLSGWSAMRQLTGASMADDDLSGITRPATDSKKSWGAVQFQPMVREATTVRTGAASLELSDAGEHQIIVPVSNESTTISVYCYREADYTGTNPRMVIKQPGQSDRTTTDAGAASQWNQLTDTFTPAAIPPYVVVCLQSLNTAAATDFKVYFDDLVVS